MMSMGKLHMFFINYARNADFVCIWSYPQRIFASFHN